MPSVPVLLVRWLRWCVRVRQQRRRVGSILHSRGSCLGEASGLSWSAGLLNYRQRLGAGAPLVHWPDGLRTTRLWLWGRNVCSAELLLLMRCPVLNATPPPWRAFGSYMATAPSARPVMSSWPNATGTMGASRSLVTTPATLHVRLSPVLWTPKLALPSAHARRRLWIAMLMFCTLSTLP